MICIQVLKKYVKNNDSYLIYYFGDLILYFDWQRTSPKLSPSESALKRHRPDTVYVQIQKLGPKETFVSPRNGLILIPLCVYITKWPKNFASFEVLICFIYIYKRQIRKVILKRTHQRSIENYSHYTKHARIKTKWCGVGSSDHLLRRKFKFNKFT